MNLVTVGWGPELFLGGALLNVRAMTPETSSAVKKAYLKFTASPPEA